MTRSMPISSGRWLTGEAVVLSTIVIAPCLRAIAATARKSVMRITGWARRFQDDQARARSDRRFERLGVALVYERHLDAEVAHDAGQKRLRAGVDVILAYDVSRS